MPNYSVKCIDRKSAKPYDLTVEADSPAEASRIASDKHILAANHQPQVLSTTAVSTPSGKPIFDPTDKHLFRTIMHAVFWGVFGAHVVLLLIALAVWICFAIPQYGQAQEKWKAETEARVREHMRETRERAPQSPPP